MSLTSAITTAQTIFSNTGTQSGVVAQNIANSSNADYSRRLAMIGVDLNGSRYVSIQRATDEALFKQNISSISQASAQSRLLDGLELLKSGYGGNDNETSPSTYLTAFRSALQTYAASSGNTTIASSAVSAARDLSNSLNAATTTTQSLRADADKEISEQVGTLNELLTKFEEVNNKVVSAVGTGADPNDALDQRDKLLKSIADIVGISTVSRTNMDTVIYSSDGTVLFETMARKVTFTPTPSYDANTTGQPIRVDGVPMKAGTGGNTTAEGTLPALLQLRDEVTPKMQSQLDEIARSLVTLFAEKDQAATPTLPDKPGLFVWSGTTVPAAGTLVKGLAGTITINSQALSDPKLVRDGGFNGAAYVKNTTQNAGYTAQIDGFVASLAGDFTFSAAAGLSEKTSIVNFASSSIGWLEQIRKAATTADENKSAALSKTEQVLSNATGVSLDEELSLMLDLEQSYKASAKLLSTVNEMLAALLESVR